MSKQKPENGLWNILFTIVIPVLILNKASSKIGAFNALLIALAFPLLFGAFDLIKKRKWNWMAILGFVNVTVTGSLAVLGLDGIWFSIKEAFFPAIIGIFIFFSAKSENPFIRTFLLNPQTMNVDMIENKLKELSKESEFLGHLKASTQLLSYSFFLSAVLNFALAERIFLPLEAALDAEAKSQILNQQIAQMHSWSLLVILVPSVVFLMGILWYLLKGIRELTGLKTEEILKG